MANHSDMAFTASAHDTDTPAGHARNIDDRRGLPGADMWSCVVRMRAWLGLVVWRRRSFRAQLLTAIVFIDLIAALTAGVIIILQTRSSVQVEVAASMRLAELLVRETIQMQQDSPDGSSLLGLPQQLRFLRHVTITARDLEGHEVATSVNQNGPQLSARETSAAAPNWFVLLIDSATEQHRFPVLYRGQPVGSVVLSSEPRDEIAEAWEHTIALALVALMLNAAVIGILYFVVGRVLGPISELALGLSRLESRNYDVRLPTPRAYDVAAITHRFNALAEALKNLHTQNQALHHKLVSVQDDERRHLALELHDEFGPNLFGLKAIAGSITTVRGDTIQDLRSRTSERIDEMLSIIEHIQGVNRSLLNRLRPMALGHIPLEAMLAEIVRDRTRQHPDIAFSFSCEGFADSYGDSIDLTIYRCVQESLTNAIKHAKAETIAVCIRNIKMDRKTETSIVSKLHLSVMDDGRGIDPIKPVGLGLVGIQERVLALGGSCNINSEIDGGTCVNVLIPVYDSENLEPSRLTEATRS